ncbi:MAG: vWA domain-containing protein [Syntrophaceae bacterium]
MFIQFFYTLRDRGVPVTPTSFLHLQRALSLGLVTSLDDFYTVARSLLVKSERYFDLYDQVFLHHFRGVELKDPETHELTDIAKALLQEWLKDPAGVAAAFGVDEKKLKKMTPEELIRYFLDRLKEQTEAHHGGSRWIGTRGTSPVGHSGTHPEGMRVGGVSRNKSAIKVAMDRRYRDYSQDGPLTQAQMGEALKRLRRMVPAGPKDLVNVDKTIRETLRNAGEIEIVFDRRLTDRLKVILMIDNGGWSMEPYVELVQTLFNYARSQFKDLRTYYFHNSVYDVVWQDAQRFYRPERLDDLALRDPETRLIFLGDASMSPYELMYSGGAIDYTQRSTRPSIDRLKFLASLFRHAVWLNPAPLWEWERVRTIGMIRQVFPMYELTLDGLEAAVRRLVAKN